jgi:molybdate transport system substrate-binding protein
MPIYFWNNIRFLERESFMEMKKITFAVFITLFAAAFVIGCVKQKPSNPEVELVISAAASLKDVTEELAEAYKKEASYAKLTFSYGGSGALQIQIEEGAPSDIFISAASRQMNNLAGKGLIFGESKNLLVNKVTLIVPADSRAGIESFADAATDKVKMIALGDPATVPAGQYAQEIFSGLGIADAVNKKANLASDVRQVLTWVELGEADCGVVYMTDAITTDKVKAVAVAEDGSHTPVIYPVGIIESSSKKEEAQKFVDFLFSHNAKLIFEKYGFAVIE